LEEGSGPPKTKGRTNGKHRKKRNEENSGREVLEMSEDQLKKLGGVVGKNKDTKKKKDKLGKKKVGRKKP